MGAALLNTLFKETKKCKISIPNCKTDILYEWRRRQKLVTVKVKALKFL